MSTLAFLLAAASAVGAAALWRLDSRKRSVAEVPEPTPETAPEPEPAPEPPAAADEAADEVADKVDETGEESAEVAPERRRHGLAMPGALRRERRAWAEEKGFDFARSDDYLNDEWSRGAAATGAAARDIVSGQAYGHEMVLMDLGGVNVMAMRRGAASDVVVDLRRGDLSTAESSEDLIEALRVGDFTIFATDTGVAQRLVEERVATALEVMPDIVTAVWMESDWVLAQTGRGSHAADWEAMLAPLALLADAARSLPPKCTSAQVLNLDGLDPTRHMPAPGVTGVSVLEIVRATGVDDGERPLVQRPEEPLDMPTRVLPVARGVVEPREVGTDDVDAIGQGHRHHPDDVPGTRMPRDLRKGPSIFDDPTH